MDCLVWGLLCGGREAGDGFRDQSRNRTGAGRALRGKITFKSAKKASGVVGIAIGEGAPLCEGQSQRCL